MTRLTRILIHGTAITTLMLASPAAFAQRNPPPPLPASAEVVSGIETRTQRLEQTIEQLTGQIEELRFQNQQLHKQVEGLQDDLSLRVMRLEQGGAAGAATAEGGAPMAAAPVPAARSSASSGRLPFNNTAITPSDKFDADAPMSAPVSRQPGATPPPAAAPTQAAAAPNAGAAGQAVTDNGGFNIRTDSFGKALPADPNAPKAPPPEAPMTPAPAPRAAPSPAPVTAAGLNSAPANVALPAGTPKQQYDFAFEILRRQDYSRAEAALRAFVKANPKDPLAGNAQYWVGETLYVRGDYQAAAVEFMSGYQQYPKSPKGPDNLLKLGMAMSKLNQAQGACTALGRITKEYPDAPDTVRKTAQSERAKLKCT